MFVRSVNLSEMCLNIIIYNLESIIFNDKIPQKNTNFLLRVYAEKVFKEYRKIKGITKAKEDIMLWFLNPHVKSITLPGRLCTEKVINQLQIVGTGLTSLNLHKSAASESELGTIINCVPCVKILDLSFTSCTDNTLSVIQKTCPSIEILNLCMCEKITDDGMKNLCGNNQSLKSLGLLGSDIGDLGVSAILRGMPLLECIKCDYLADLLLKISNDHQKHDLKEVKYNLKELIFFNGRLNVNSLKALTILCPEIKKVHFNLPLDKEVLQACTGFQKLEELKISGCHKFLYVGDRIDDILAPILPIALNLKTLILSCLEIDTVMLIEEFKNLKKLYMKNVTFTFFDPADITCEENKLEVLVIKDADMEVSNLTYNAIVLLISLSKNVTKLYLGYFRELPSRLLHMILYSMKNLSAVYFRYVDNELHSLSPFFGMPSMKKIYIHGIYDTGNFAKEKLSPKSSSTLSWQYMHGFEDFKYNTPFENDVCVSDDDYDDYSTDSIDETVISDYCDSVDLWQQ